MKVNTALSQTSTSDRNIGKSIPNRKVSHASYESVHFVTNIDRITWVPYLLQEVLKEHNLKPRIFMELKGFNFLQGCPHRFNLLYSGRWGKIYSSTSCRWWRPQALGTVNSCDAYWWAAPICTATWAGISWGDHRAKIWEGPCMLGHSNRPATEDRLHKYPPCVSLQYSGWSRTIRLQIIKCFENCSFIC